jgi:hypothetical protein
MTNSSKGRGLIVQPISNTFTRDFSIDKQVALGIADWKAEDDNGYVAFGHSEQEARDNFAAL